MVLIFNPHRFSVKKQFGSDWVLIRPAKIEDRDLVWQGYKNTPKEFFNQITEITKWIIEQWYPATGDINYNQVLPFNVMMLEQEIAFAGNITLDFRNVNRFRHSIMMDMTGPDGLYPQIWIFMK